MRRPNTDAQVLMSYASLAVFAAIAGDLFGWKGVALAFSGYLAIVFAMAGVEAALNGKLEAIREVLAEIRYQTRNLGDGR